MSDDQIIKNAKDKLIELKRTGASIEKIRESFYKFRVIAKLLVKNRMKNKKNIDENSIKKDLFDKSFYKDLGRLKEVFDPNNTERRNMHFKINLLALTRAFLKTVIESDDFSFNDEIKYIYRYCIDTLNYSKEDFECKDVQCIIWDIIWNEELKRTGEKSFLGGIKGHEKAYGTEEEKNKKHSVYQNKVNELSKKTSMPYEQITIQVANEFEVCQKTIKRYTSDPKKIIKYKKD